MSNTGDAQTRASDLDAPARDAMAIIDDATRSGTPERIVELFDRGGLAGATSAAPGCHAAEALLKLNRNDDAIRVLAGVADAFASERRPKQLQGLALARRGSPADLSAAQEILRALYEGGARDPETLGIYARTWKSRFSYSGDIADLRRARDLYREAHAADATDHYGAINVASMSLLLDTPADKRMAQEYAQHTHDILGTEARPGDFWGTVSVAEAWLVKEQYEQAGRIYAAALEMAPSEIGSHGTTWDQICRLMHVLRPSVGNRALIRQPFRHLPEGERQPG